MKKALPIIVVALCVVLLGMSALTFIKGRNNNEQPYGGPFKLTTMNGDPITEKDLRAKPAILFFGFTHCPDVCPTTLFEIDGLMNELGPDADKVGAFYITVDPERDTQEIMKTYVGNVSPHILGITGTPEEIADVIKAYHIYSKKVPGEDGYYSMDHTASVFLLDKGGIFFDTIAYQEDHDSALAKLKKLINR